MCIKVDLANTFKETLTIKVDDSTIIQRVVSVNLPNNYYHCQYKIKDYPLMVENFKAQATTATSINTMTPLVSDQAWKGR